MKKILLFMLTLIVSVGASAEKLQMDLTNLGTGWGSSYDTTTKTITFNESWQGRGWWCGEENSGAWDCSRYTQFVLEIESTNKNVASGEEPANLYVVVKVEYTTKNGDNFTCSEAGITGAGKVTVTLDDAKKYSVRQVYIQSDAAGTVVLKDAYFYGKPSFNATKQNVTATTNDEENDVAFALSDLESLPTNAIITLIGIANEGKENTGMGKIRDSSWGELKSLRNYSPTAGADSEFSLPLSEFIGYAQSDGKVYVQYWNGKFKEAYITLNHITITLSSAGIGSMILPFAAAIPEGMKVFEVGSYDNNTLHLNSVETIAANTPYIIKGTAKDYEFIGVAEAENFQYTVGNLCGTYESIKAPVGSYVLQNGTSGAGFYPVESGKQPTVKAHRAYLTNLPTQSGAKLNLVFGDETTAIDNMSVADKVANSNSFNIIGQKVGKHYKGIVIKNGKKFYVK